LPDFRTSLLGAKNLVLFSEFRRFEIQEGLKLKDLLDEKKLLDYLKQKGNLK